MAGAFLGGEDKYKMSPEQRRIYEMLLREYESGDYGYSQADLGEMKSSLKSNLLEESQAATGRNIASLGRRGVSGAGQLAGMTASTSADYGRAYGKGITDINVAGAESKLRGKAALRSALLGSSQGDYVPADDSIFGDIGQAGGNWMLYDLLKKQNKKPTLKDIFYGG